MRAGFNGLFVTFFLIEWLYKGLVTHNDVLKIYITIAFKKILEYFEIIFEIF